MREHTQMPGTARRTPPRESKSRAVVCAKPHGAKARPPWAAARGGAWGTVPARSSAWGTIVVPYDFSAHSQAALHAAVDLAARLGSRLHLLHVVAAPAYLYGYGGVVAGATAVQADLDAIREGAAGALGEVAGKLDEESIDATTHVLESGDIAGAIARKADEIDADLIVMGTHGRTGISRAFLGSVTERTLRSSPCPVLAIRGDEAEEEGGHA